MPHITPAHELDELIAAHSRNIEAMRSNLASRYGSAVIGTGDAEPDEADLFRLAAVWGAVL